MRFTLAEIKKMNDIQIELFREFEKVCCQLNLNYYFVHGSLLGAVRCSGFIPYDDDIDIVMMRNDYNLLVSKASDLMPKHLFLQSYLTDPQYPLPFAKIRNSNTTFTQTVMRNLDINQGIYIDIFPMDNYPTDILRQKYLYIKEKIYGLRISDRLYFEEKQSFIRKAARIVSKVLCPSWKRAVKKRALLYANEKVTGKVITIGGKNKERGIPQSWFEQPTNYSFEGISVCCPTDVDKYLRCIYGEYENYDPMGKYMNSDGTVTLSAELYSIEESFINKIQLSCGQRGKQ